MGLLGVCVVVCCVVLLRGVGYWWAVSVLLGVVGVGVCSWVLWVLPGSVVCCRVLLSTAGWLLGVVG